MKKLFDEHRIEGPDGLRLRAASLAPKGPVERVLLITPLIGASAEDQLISFRELTRHGTRTYSFEFRGHGESADPFSLGNSVADTAAALDWIASVAEGRPVHVLTACYSAVPLLAVLARRSTASVRTLIGINSLFSLQEIVRPAALLRLVAERTGERLDEDGLLAAVAAGRIDVHEPEFLALFADYLRTLFPGFRITAERFEELEWRRADIQSMVREYMGNRMLADVRAPRELPALFLYGTADRVLHLDRADGRRTYEAQVRRHAPVARLERLDFDHYFKGPDHRAALNRVTAFQREHEPVPATSPSSSGMPTRA